MAVDVGTLLVTMGMDTAPYVAGTHRATAATTQMESRMTRATGLVKGAITGMLAAFSVDMFVNMAMESLNFVASLEEQATQLGVTTDTLQEYRYAATQTGIAQEDMEKSLAKLTVSLGKAADGSKKEAETFQRLGINVRDANGHIREAGDIIPEIARAFETITDPAERSRILIDLFGRSGQKLLPLLSEGQQGVNNLTNAARDLGLVLSQEEIQNADKTADKIDQFKQVLQMRFNSAIVSNTQDINKFIESVEKLLDVGQRLMNSPVGRFVQWTNYYVNPLGFAREGAVNGINDILSLLPDQQPANGGRRPAARPAAPAARAAGNRPSSNGALLIDPRFRGVRNFIDDLSDQAMNGAPAITTAIATIDRQVTQLATTMTNADPAVQSLMDRLFPVEQRQRQLAEEIALINRSTLATEQKARAIAALRREYGAFGEGMTDWRDVIGDVGGDVDAEMARVQDVLGTVVDGWADAASGVEAQNVRIVESTAQMAQNALREIDGLARSIKSGDILGILSGVLGALDQIGGLTPGGFNFLGMQFGGARASGGPVRAGSTYLVGERGPELFHAGASGAIIPNHALGGGGSQTIHINVNAQGAVLAGQVEAMVAAGVEIATQRGAAMGATMARTRMIRDNQRIPA